LPKSRAPTAGDVIALYRLRENDGSERRLRALAHNFRVLTQMDHAIDIPAQYKATTKEVRTPFIRDAWLRTTASLTLKNWLAHVEPVNETRDAKAAANIGERWLMAGCAAMDKALGMKVLHENVKALVRDAESVIKVVDRREAWATFPKLNPGDDAGGYERRLDDFKKGQPFPYAWRVIDRLQMIFGDGEFGDEWVIEYGEYPRPLLKNQYGMSYDEAEGRLKSRSRSADWSDDDRERVTPAMTLGGTPRPEGYSRSATGVAVKIEYFDADWWCVVIDGNMAPGFPKENPYSPRLPYFRARPDEECEPVLYSLLFLGPRLDELLTMWMNWAYLGAYPNPYLEDIPNSNAMPGSLEPPLGDDAQPSTFQWTPGKFLEIPRGKRFAFMSPPQVGGDIRQMSDLLRGLIDIAGIPSILRGSTMSGDSGYLANQMIAAATMMYKRLALSVESQYERIGDFLFFNVSKTFKSHKVWVQGQGENGKAWLALRDEGDVTEHIGTIEKMGPLTITLSPILPTMDQANALIARQLTEGDRPLDSRQHAMEKWLGYEDPLTIMDQIFVEQAMEAEPLRTLILDDALRRSGLTPTPPPPPTGLVGPDGMPIQTMPGMPAELSGGQPVMPGMNAPFMQEGGGSVIGAPGGRPAGAFPGLPPNPMAI
jgi:hypothetical protein